MRMRLKVARKASKRIGKLPKVSDDILEKYLNRYEGFTKKDIWRIMKADGYGLSYQQFLHRIKRLKLT